VLFCSPLRLWLAFLLCAVCVWRCVERPVALLVTPAPSLLPRRMPGTRVVIWTT
ncbi:hypothetical protein XENOCAPTIV_009979, partial [Xenoophorus captivus]